MKKFVIISSSPRKNGNSDLLAQEFLKGALEAGNEGELISLRDKKIGYCLACNYCHSHDNTCVLKDNMTEILNKMKEADILVLATPVYYYNISAQMKTFIDRTFACFMDLKDKELYYLCSCTDEERESIDGALRAFHGFAICLPNSKESGVVYGTGNPNHGDIKEKPQMMEAYEMGKKI
ncbi:MAG: flavodoxin family protein [Erysipelotrichaceae bacterium]|nr:flavodoxin family protein [Erysipelotrichaceae bacterium]